LSRCRATRDGHIRSSQEKSSTVSKNVAMFIDVANIYYAARGQDVDVDYVALLKHATKGRDLIRAYAYSGLDPENENQRKFIDFLSKNGYKVVTKDIRKFGDGRVKANLDIELVVDLFRLADRMDIAVVVSGDGDFAPAIRALQDTGVRCEVISFKPNTSSDLIAVADEFQDIQKIAGIGRKKGEGSRADAMATPEMPAKEVVPEFGFREASPSIAAAALAAIRSGGSTSRGRGRGRAAAAAAEDSDEAAVAAGAPSATATNGDADETGRRRRRRRGGRGRSRGRREEVVEATPPAPDAEIGWEEFDDVSQLEGLGEEREYTFSEADPETLRELGLLDGDTPVATVAEPATEPDAAATDSKPRSRRRAPRAAAEPPAAEAPVPGAEEPKPTRRRSTRRTAATVEETAATAEEPKPRARRRTARPAVEAEGESTDAKPARRRTTRTRTSGEADAAPPAETTAGEPEPAPQGIWGRFRSGRSGQNRG
jgi:uncharacterized LabA/DUF88 family protein